MKIVTKLWLGIAGLIVLTPLGLILPEYFKAGSAWGEWGANGIWKAPMSDYAIKGWQGKGLSHLTFSYIISAVLGVIIIVILVFIIGKALSRRSEYSMPDNNAFIERSLVGALSFLKESIFSEEYAAKNGFLQSLDPRIKAVTFFLFILQILFAKSILVLLCLYLFCLFLTQISKINLGFFLRRTWVFIPLFSLFIALPALFSIFTPGETLASLKLAGITLAITRQGLKGAELFIMRVITSVSFVVLLSLSSKHFELLRVLRILKIPQVFVMVFGMCYRYVYLFVEIIENTYLAIKSRVGTRVHYKRGQHLVAWNIAFLWQRSFKLNEEVYQAMLSRGYQGEPVVLNDFKAKTIDFVWVFMVGLIWIITFLN